MVLDAIKAGGWPLTFLILGALIVAPIGEEVLFRGLLLGRFGVYGYWRTGVVLSTPLLSDGDYTLMRIAAGSRTTRTAQSFAHPRLGLHSRLSSSFIVTTP
jgi:hypothetical protein